MNTASTAPELLIIERDAAPRRAIASLLRKQGYAVQVAGDGSSGLEALHRRPIALALVDAQLPDMDGAEVIRRLRQQSPATAAIVLTDAACAGIAASTLSAGASDYFSRPIRDWERFNQTITRCLDAWCARQGGHGRDVSPIHGRAPRGAISLLKGNSSAMRELLETIRDLAPLPDTLLIRGESGVGKELVARAVHEQSMVREGPFVAVNCAAIKPELFESELFGHRAGAFTGATRERSGLIESAQNGTLFLDEIGELSSDLQAKLLRLLEQREYRRVGAEQRRLLEARVVAATHVDLETAIEARRFRQDLYFRLSALELRVPPLRDRRDDIQLLAYHFLNKYNHRYDRSVDRIAPRALRLLENADWKRNNVRELEWSIRQAVARCKNQRELTVESFRDRVIPGAAPISLPRPAHQAPMAVDRGDVLDISDLLDVNYGEAIKDLRRRFATRYAERCLQVANYNKSRAAEIAGMKRSNFSRLIKDLELKIPEPLPMKA